MLDTSTDAGARAQERLGREEVVWMTTVRPDGQPQSVPVWFLWDGEAFLIYSQPDTRKLKNIARNPRINLNLNSNDVGEDVARAECTAEVVEDVPPATEVGPYLEKYREGIARIGMDPEGFAGSFSVPIRATPTRWQVW
jgi:PPOX class probable F420-dependent enzyme